MSKIELTKPTLLLMYGYPGAGKTNFARQFSDRVNAAHVQADRIRSELFEEPHYDAQEDEVVGHIMEYMTAEFLKAGISVIYDMNAARLAERRKLRDMARRLNGHPVLVWIQVDAETSFMRASKRDKRRSDDKYSAEVDKDQFMQLASRMRNPDRTEDYIVISGKHSFDTQFSAVMRRLYEQGITEANSANTQVIKPGMVNLIPKGRVDKSRRNIFIR